MIIVADTGPVNYLILSGYIDLVRQLYGSLILPASVRGELLHPKAPSAVRQWASVLPSWVSVRGALELSRFSELGPGEREAITLALELKADYLLIDETFGRTIATAQSIPVKGILGVLEDAADQHLIDLNEAVGRLKTTSIFLSDEIVKRVLERRRSR